MLPVDGIRTSVGARLPCELGSVSLADIDSINPTNLLVNRWTLLDIIFTGKKFLVTLPISGQYSTDFLSYLGFLDF